MSISFFYYYFRNFSQIYHRRLTLTNTFIGKILEVLQKNSLRELSDEDYTCMIKFCWVQSHMTTHRKHEGTVKSLNLHQIEQNELEKWIKCPLRYYQRSHLQICKLCKSEMPLFVHYIFFNYSIYNWFPSNDLFILINIAHPARKRRDDVVVMSFFTYQDVTSTSENETFNDVSVRCCQDVSVVSGTSPWRHKGMSRQCLKSA